jgi:excisionase family DNA binding protein
MTDRYLTVQEVADLVRCEHRVVRKAIHRGELEAAMIGGRWLVREDAVQAWFDARVQRPGPPVQRQRAPKATPQTEGRRSVARLRAMEGQG